MSQDYFWSLLAKKLASEASIEELQQLDEILRSYPELQYTAKHLEDLWNVETKHDLHDTQIKFDKHLKQLESNGVSLPFSENKSDLKISPAHKIVSIRIWIAAASVLAVIITGLFLYKKELRPSIDANKQVNEVYSRPGTRTKLVLPDSSVVWLNASSQLSYDKSFGKNFREVDLTGEAYFDVTKDAEHPFIIHTKNVDVKVLGTQFNVKAYPEEPNTETTLIRGSVELTVKNRGNEKLYLKPNEKAVVNNAAIPPENKIKPKSEQPLITIGPLHRVEGDSTVVETSWVDNKLIFQENETFKDAALQMERWFGVSMRFASEKVANYHLFASFTNETISQALEELKLGFQFNYKIEGKNITITE